MPFGAHPCPAKFQETMMRVFNSMPSDKVTCYMDDILIHSENVEEHLKDLETVLNLLRQHGLKLSSTKCKLFQTKIEYLGFMIGDNNGKIGYSPIDDKIKALQEAKMPETAKDVRSFCGGLQYYNHMIPRLNILLSPLHRGAAKTPFIMTNTMKSAYKEVKEALKIRVMLAFPDFTLPFKLSTDASYEGAAGILSQRHEDGTEEIIYAFSKTFDEVQTRWAIVELECLALVWSLDKMKELLLGREFVWLTDSLVLKQMIENPPKDLSRSARKISRYIDFISQFQFTARHEKGDKPETALADFFSRNPVATIHTFFRLQLTEKEWIQATSQDAQLMNATGQWLKYANKLFKENDIVYLQGKPRCKVAVPTTLVTKVLRYYHENFTIHGGISRMITLISGIFFWPQMYKDIKDFVSNCCKCAESKNLPMEAGTRRPIETPKRPFQWIQIDLVSVSKKPSDKGNRYLLTCVCCLTNFLIMEPIPSKEAIVVLDALCRIFCLAGVPEIVQSDNGKEFVSSIMQTHAKWLNIEWRFSTPYKPSTNGRIERRHADLGKILKLLDSTDNNWCEKIPFVAFEINSTIDGETTLTPFEHFHGWPARVPHVLQNIPCATNTSNFTEWSNKVDKISWEVNLRRQQARTFENIKKQRDAMKEQTAMSQQMKPQLVPGDRVMVKLPSTGKLSKKLQGPYRVIKVALGGSFTAEEENGNKIVNLPASHARRIKEISVKESASHEEPQRERRTRGAKVDYKKFFGEEGEEE